ncbi:hypothetical protein LTR94_030389, partial [Friedmanniomyces endolithicus]
PARVRFRAMVARRSVATGPARLRGSASVCAERTVGDQFGGGEHPQPDREGGPQIWRLAGSDYAATLGPCRGRVVAMRHDHRDAAQQRTGPGVRPRGDAGGRARFPRHAAGAPQPRMHHLRRGRVDPDPRLVRHAGRGSASGIRRPDLLGAVARTGGRGSEHRAHHPAMAAGPL